jgi:transposase
VSFLIVWDSHSRDSPSPISGRRWWRKAWWLRSAALPCGVGCMRMLFVLGSTAVGSFPAIQISQPRRHASWTSMNACPQGVPLSPTDFVISADEKTSVQARRRKQPTLAVASGRPMRVEHEYFREGAWTYLAAWDLHRAKLFGRCETKSGIAPTDRLMAEVMTQEPYRSANRVFWIMDNCSAHRGQKAVQRIRSQWPHAILVHTPIHASWLNQIEIYFSIVQKKVLTPNDFSSLSQLEQRLLDFQKHYQQTASPFQWTFTRKDLNAWPSSPQKPSLPLPPETPNRIRHRNSEPQH